jgi:hypothetical protein
MLRTGFTAGLSAGVVWAETAAEPAVRARAVMAARSRQEGARMDAL